MQTNSITQISHAETFFIAVYCLFAIFIAASTFYFITLCYHLGPFRDMWIAMEFIRGFFEGNTPWHEAFSLHGGAHRLVVPKFFFLLEYGVFQGTNLSLIAVSTIFQCAVIICIAKALHSESHIPNYHRYFFIAVTTILMFNATQLENFVYTFDMQWFLTASSAVVSLYYWSHIFASRETSIAPFVAAVLATFCSMFSSFSGLCLLIVIPLLALCYRVKRTYLLTLTASCLVLIILYMRGPFAEGGDWNAPQTVTANFVLNTLLSWFVLLTKWLALYFGSPLGRDYFWLGAICAYGSLFLLIGQWFSLLRHGVENKTRFQIFALALALFAAIVGTATGFGRMYFVNTADEDRYQSIVLIYWLGIFAYIYSASLWQRLQNKQLKNFGLALSFILFWTVIVIPLAGIKDARAQLNQFNRVNNSNLAIATRQYDFQAIKATLILGDKSKKINRPAMHADYLAQQGWGIFHHPLAKSLGTTITVQLPQKQSLQSCPGQATKTEKLSAPYGGYAIKGTITTESGQNIRQVIAVDNNQVLLGFGRPQRPKDSLLPIPTGEKNSWLLYTIPIKRNIELFLFGQNDEGFFCLLGSAKLRV